MAVYSHSRLTSHESCPRKFLWRYVWSVEPPVEGVEAFTGKRVHETLEDLYGGLLRGGVPPSRGTVLESYHALWERHWHDGVRIVKQVPAETYRRQGARCLEDYYERHHPFTAGTTLAVERRFEVALGEHRLRGIFDRVDIGPDGAIEVHDYKTGKRTPSRRDLEADLQVGLYEIAARQLYPDRREVRMVWHYLRSGVERRLEARGPDSLRALRRGTLGRIDRIEQQVAGYRGGLDGEGLRQLAAADRAAPLESVPEAARPETPDFPARVSALCRWCSFLAWCPEGSRHAGKAFRPPAPPAFRPPPRPATADPRQASLF